jgi:hypothetical protein
MVYVGTLLAAPATDRVIREALDRVDQAFGRRAEPKTPEQQARDQIQIAKASLAEGMEWRRYQMRCFPGLYRRDRKECLQHSCARLADAAKRRRHAAALLAQASNSITAQQKAA